MRYRRFGRTGWQVSELGYGMWGMGGWTGSDDAESRASLERALELGCNFFDTAWAYGQGRSERLLSDLVRAHPSTRVYTATKIPPLNLEWPARPDVPLAEAYPESHILDYTRKSLENLGQDRIDLIQFHVWSDQWAADHAWADSVERLKESGAVGAVGISLNRWEPENGLVALKTGVLDAVQVVYNIFDQAPEDALFPFCRDHDIAVIARVPFDEGSLTGTLTADSKWPEGDWRNGYFNRSNLAASLERVAALRRILPADLDLPAMALRFILSSPEVATVIPGMRKLRHVEANLTAGDRGVLPDIILDKLREHRWDRKPAPWSR